MSDDLTPELENRSVDVELEFRAAEEDGYLEGIAMPDGQVATVYDKKTGKTYQERFERGAIETDGTVWLYDDHKTPIGVVEAAEYRSEGFWIRAKFALSDLAKSVREAAINGALNKLSVSFTPLESRNENGVIVRAKARLREVSVTPNPVYQLATVTAIRSEETEREPLANNKEETVEDSTVSTDELIEVRGQVEELERRFDTLATSTYVAPAEDKVETRSAAQILKDLVAGDEDTTSYVNDLQTRAYTGGVIADAPLKSPWVKDLTEIFDASSGVWSQIFGTGTLPEEGMDFTFTRRLPTANTVAVNAQAAEGDDISFGNIELENDTAAISTYAGGTSLSLQQIKRSSLPMLQRNLEALAVAAGAKKKAVLRAAFGTVRAAQVTASNTVTLGEGLDDVTASQWADLIVDAAIKYEAKNAAFQYLVVSPAVFKHLNKLEVSGHRVFNVAPDTNTLGSLNLTGLVGNIGGVTVVCDTGASGSLATFVNGDALRQYDSGLVSLQQDNIVNLTNSFAVYRFGAVADEIPDFIVPVVIPAND